LLPLLDARALTPEEETSLREHLADCAWCQNQLAAYMVVEEAVRRQYATLPSPQPLTLEEIMRATQSGRQSDMRPASASRATSQPLPRRADPPETRGRGGDQRRPKPWATLGAVAAAMLLVVLAAALFAGLRLQTPGGAPATSVTATSVPAASCATELQGATPATAVPGFTNVTFPAGAVMTTVKSSLGGPSQFTVLETDVCYSGAADDLTGPVSDHHSVIANLLGAGWRVSSSFPYQGALLQPCPNQCYQTANTRYLALEQITDHGASVFTYHLRLVAPPPPPTCNANFTNSPIQGVQTAVEGAPLPPVTYVVPDNAAGLRGYDLCSSGDVASITAFLTSALPDTGWTKVASNARCFYTDQCWTKGSAAISWHVNDPTDWLIAYHPATS
jgi:hypothetical protein